MGIFYFKIIQNFLYKIFVAIVINIKKKDGKKIYINFILYDKKEGKRVRDLTYVHTYI